MSEENKAIVRRIFRDFLNAGNLEAANDLFAPDFVNHSPGRRTTPDREGLKQFIAYLHAAFPDVSWTIDDLVADGDRVAIRMTLRGTHTGDLFGIPPTGKRIDMAAMTILRFAGGKAVERWNVSDDLLLLQQIGVIPPMG